MKRLKSFVFILVFVSSLFIVISFYYLPVKRSPNDIDLNNKHNEVEPKLWYDPETPYDDRILNQLNHVPEAYKRALKNGKLPRKITILRYQGFKKKMYGAFVDPKKNIFEKCAVSRCELTDDRNQQSNVDAIIFEYEHPERNPKIHPVQQIWIVYKIEGPHISSGLHPGDQFNWTASYRPDSTLSVPHYKFIKEYHPKPKRLSKNYAKGKTKKIAWFSSKCDTPNKRIDYVRELRRYMPIDIYGKCGNYSCRKFGAECFEILRKNYKFYLAFENSNCRHYITEKLVRNALVSDTLPIVMGAPQEDYEMRAPPNSYIHVDDFKSPRQLAEYLHVLDNNDDLYNSYFKWKTTGHFIGAESTKFWCRLCSMLHEQDSNPHPTWYEDTNKWWRGKGVCVGSDNWKDHQLN